MPTERDLTERDLFEGLRMELLLLASVAREPSRCATGTNRD